MATKSSKTKASKTKNQTNKLTKKLKKGAKVEIRSGKYKGKSGKVIEINRSKNRVYVEGVNELTDFNKVDESGARSIVKKNVGIDISNVKIPETTKK